MKIWKSESYAKLPALSVRGKQLKRSLRTITAAWMFGIVWLIAVSGSHFKVLAEAMGFDDFTFGLLATLPFLATIGQLFAAMIIERTGVLKYQFIHCGTVSRLLWLLVAAIPLVLPIPSHIAVVLTLLAITASWFFQALAVPAWLTWMGVFVPRRIRGRYFASRERAAMGVQIVAVLSFGLAMDLVDPGSPGGEQMRVWIACGIVALGAVCGLIDILAFRRVPEVLPPRQPASETDAPARLGPHGAKARRLNLPILQYLLGPLTDHTFRSYVLFGATLTFSVTVCVWFHWLNALDNLGFSNFGVNALFLVATPLAGMWTIRRWGQAIDRWGRRPVMIICTAGIAVGAAFWLVVSPDLPAPAFVTSGLAWAAEGVGGLVGRPEWGQAVVGAPLTAYALAAVACALGGAAWSGISLAQTGIVLGFADGTGQSRYVAASSVLIGVGGILGGLVGGSVAQATQSLQDHPIRLGPFLWNNWHLTFAISLAARLVAIGWLARMPEPGAVRARSLARYMGANAYNGIVSRLFYPLRVFGWQQPVRPAEPPRPHQ